MSHGGGHGRRGRHPALRLIETHGGGGGGGATVVLWILVVVLLAVKLW